MAFAHLDIKIKTRKKNIISKHNILRPNKAQEISKCIHVNFFSIFLLRCGHHFILDVAKYTYICIDSIITFFLIFFISFSEICCYLHYWDIYLETITNDLFPY